MSNLLEDKITIIVSTLNKGVEKIQKLVSIQHPQLVYLVVFQNTTGTSIPSFLKREDIKVIEINSLGLSKSRNVGLRSCKTKYALFSDDDVIYFDNTVNDILESFATTQADVLTFKIKTGENEPDYKEYQPQQSHLNKLPRTHFISSIEIAINVASIINNNISFDERFGLGTPMKKGEESIFISDCKRIGLNCIYIPIFIVCHPFESSRYNKITRKERVMYHAAFTKRTGIKVLFHNKLKYLFRPDYILDNYYRKKGVNYVK